MVYKYSCVHARVKNTCICHDAFYNVQIEPKRKNTKPSTHTNTVHAHQRKPGTV